MSAHRLHMYEQIARHAALAKRRGLAVVIWSYPRGVGPTRNQPLHDGQARRAMLVARILS